MAKATATSSGNSYGNVTPSDATWTSDASGNATVTISIYGVILGILIVPGSGGNLPSANYDMVLNDKYGYDLMRGQGANLSNSVAKNFVPVIDATDGTNTVYAPIARNEDATLVVSNAGNTKSGHVVVFYR